jgi:GxxExxY protein
MLEQGYRLDLLVNSQIVLEIKAVEELTDIHQAQLLSYLKFSGCPLGYLLNFNVRLMKHGIKRRLMSKNLA